MGDQYTGVFSSLLISTAPKSTTFFLVTKLNPVTVVIMAPMIIKIIARFFMLCLVVFGNYLQFICQLPGFDFRVIPMIVSKSEKIIPHHIHTSL